MCAVRLLVIGHSTSAGGGLPSQSLAWPWLAAADLSLSLGEPVDVRNVIFVPMGTRAVGYAMAKVEEYDPDVVVVSLASYVCAIGTVGERVRRRYGERAHRLYRRFEARFEAATRDATGTPGRANRGARWLARHTIGTATYTSVEEVSSVFEELLSTLARREGMQVVALAEPQWPHWVVKRNRQAATIFSTLCARARAAVDAHHLIWADSDPRYSAAPDRDALYQADGVHKSIAGHVLQARDVVEALTGPGGPLAPGGAQPGISELPGQRVPEPPHRSPGATSPHS